MTAAAAPTAKLPFMVEAKDSANVRDFGHDQATGDLHVRFRNGGHYVYGAVPEALYHKMLAADSVGGFLHGHVRGAFKHRKL